MNTERVSGLRQGTTLWRVVIVATTVIVGLVLVWLFAFRGSGSQSRTDRSNEIASLIGASGCARSGFKIENRLDSSQSPVYVCGLAGGLKCVTYEGGIARDVTSEVRLLFSDTLGSEKPACIA